MVTSHLLQIIIRHTDILSRDLQNLAPTCRFTGKDCLTLPRFPPADEVVVIHGNLVGFKDADGDATPWHLSMNAISIDPTFGNA